MGFCCKIQSLNDLTPSQISRPVTHCLQWLRAKARANLWWRHKSFPGETSIALRPCAGKAGSQKGLGDAWVSYHQTNVVNDKSDFGRNSPLTESRTSSANHLFTLHTAVHADDRESAILSSPFQFRTWNIACNFCSGWGWVACRTECMLH